MLLEIRTITEESVVSTHPLVRQYAGENAMESWHIGREIGSYSVNWAMSTQECGGVLT
jgi:hypothetical protein